MENILQSIFSFVLVMSLLALVAFLSMQDPMQDHIVTPLLAIIASGAGFYFGTTVKDLQDIKENKPSKK